MAFNNKYYTVVIVSIILVASMMWVINIETTEKLKEMHEIEAGPKGNVVYKNRCGTCHQFDTTTSGKMNLGKPGETMDSDSLRSFIELPPPPMVEWDGTPEELDALVEYILAGPSEVLETEESE